MESQNEKKGSRPIWTTPQLVGYSGQSVSDCLHVNSVEGLVGVSVEFDNYVS